MSNKLLVIITINIEMKRGKMIYTKQNCEHKIKYHIIFLSLQKKYILYGKIYFVKRKILFTYRYYK